MSEESNSKYFQVALVAFWCGVFNAYLAHLSGVFG